MFTIHHAEAIDEPWADHGGAPWQTYDPGNLDEPQDREDGEEARPRRVGMVRIVGVLLVIIALLGYLAVPVTTFTRTQIRGQRPDRIQPIPVSPEHKSVMLRV